MANDYKKHELLENSEKLLLVPSQDFLSVKNKLNFRQVAWLAFPSLSIAKTE